VLLYAHVGHQLIWLLYAVPILIVAAAIVRSMLAQRRWESDEEERA
jgi:heme exporter protein D